MVRDYVYAGDVAAAVAAAVEYRGPSTTLNVGTGIGRSVRQVIEEVERCTGRPIEIAWRPGRRFDAPTSVLDISLIRRRLHWTPATSFADGLCRMSDVALLPSRFAGESFPLVLIQALRNGTPAVATGVGSIPAMVQADGRSAGVLIDPGGGRESLVAALADAMVRLCDDGFRRDRAADASVLGRRVSIERCAGTYAEL